jgi:hypothetical protein
MGINSVIKFFCLVAFTSILSVSVLAQEATIAVNTKSTWHKNAVDALFTNNRIIGAAEELKEYAPIPRIAFYDIGYPKDKAEFEALNGYGVLLVNALSQKEIELPLKRAYFVLNGKEVELKLLRQVLSKEENLKSQTVKTFGQFRVDALYLFPVALRRGVGDLLIDFAQNRNGMKLDSFNGETPNFLKDFVESKPVDTKSFEKSLEGFTKREYSGFYEAK